MSWEDDEEDWEANTNTFVGGGGNGSDSDEDETVAEMEKEKNAGENSNKTQEQVLIDLITEQTKGIMKNTDGGSPAEGQELTEAEKRAAMLKGIKAAEEADNRLTEELFGGASASALHEEESKFEDVVETVSRMKLSTGDHYKRLARALCNKLPVDTENAVSMFVDGLVKELMVGDACEKVDALNGRLSELLTKRKAFEAATQKPEEPKAEEASGAAPKKADDFDMMNMMDNVSDGDDYEDDEDGYDFM